jgi:formiminoglutamase
MKKVFMHLDPNWPRAGHWLAAGSESFNLGVMGAPVRMGSITPGRTDLTPPAVRDVLLRFSTYDIETDLDLGSLGVRDFGDLNLADASLEDSFEPVRRLAREILSTGANCVLLGGDNGITFPGVTALADCYGGLENVGLLTLDAHFDLRDTSAGLSNGNPVRSLLNAGLPGVNIVQLGILGYANSEAYAKVARDAGIRVTTMDRLRVNGIDATVGDSLEYFAGRVKAVYFDLDVDVLDRSFAPACPGARPGGLMPWQIKRAAQLCGGSGIVKAMDLVEVDASRDVAEITLMATAACLLSYAGGMLEAKSRT